MLFVCLAYRAVGFTCLCEPGFIVNRDTGECTTQLCSDDEDTFCMNQGVCQEPGACDCHREWIDHNCETCESATSRLLLNCIFVFKRVHAILTFPRLRLAEDSVFTGENLLKHPNHTTHNKHVQPAAPIDAATIVLPHEELHDSMVAISESRDLLMPSLKQVPL